MEYFKDEMESSPHYRASYHRMMADFCKADKDMTGFRLHSGYALMAEREIIREQKLEELNEMFRPLEN